MKAANCPAGTIITVPKGLVTHFGVYIGNGRVIDNSREAVGVSERSQEAFSSGKEIGFFDIPNTQNEGEHRVACAKEHLGQAYRLLSWNCEHFSKLVSTNRASSTQVTGMVVGATLGTAYGKSVQAAVLGGVAGLLIARCLA